MADIRNFTHTPLDESGDDPGEKVKAKARRKKKKQKSTAGKQKQQTSRPVTTPRIVQKKQWFPGLSDAEKSTNKLLEGTSRGLQAMGAAIEPRPNLIKCDNEKHFVSETNAAIILGKNRAGSCMSGFGGLGHTHAAEVSIRAGIGGCNARSGIWAHPTNQDAAFVTISQKNAVDDNLQFPPGRQPMVTVDNPRSSFVAVADAVRVKAREGVKIWAGSEEMNSQCSRISDVAYGIDLIWGDGRDMQPIPKGANLVEALMEITERVDKLAGLVDAFLTTQFLFNEAVSIHTHQSPFFAAPVPPSPELLVAGPAIFVDQSIRVKSGLLSQKVNLAMYRLKYLNPIGDKWILSLHNNTN